MNTSLDCIPCFIRQALEAARFTSDNPALHEAVVRRVLDAAAKIDLMRSPPCCKPVDSSAIEGNNRMPRSVP